MLSGVDYNHKNKPDKFEEDIKEVEIYTKYNLSSDSSYHELSLSKSNRPLIFNFPNIDKFFRYSKNAPTYSSKIFASAKPTHSP